MKFIIKIVMFLTKKIGEPMWPINSELPYKLSPKIPAINTTRSGVTSTRYQIIVAFFLFSCEQNNVIQNV